jgi:WhiB family redox-sensing transcriptional regulator
VALRSVDGTWQHLAACRGPESASFYPPAIPETRPERDSRERRAKMICASCGVQAPCLAYALETREAHGIWGGLNEAERLALLEARAG